MKKLITILFMFSFALQAQENWSPFKPDNSLHFGVGGVIAIISLPLMYNATEDWEGSINGTIWGTIGIAAGKETLDLFKYFATGKGGGASISDFCYTVIGAVIFALITKYVIIQIQKWKRIYK